MDRLPQCVFSPPSPMPAASVTLTIQTTAPTANVQNLSGRRTRYHALLLRGMLTFGSREQSMSGMRLLGLIAILGASTLWLSSCGGASSSATPSGGGAATLVSIAVSPANPSIAAGNSQPFTATGNYSDGTTKDVTSTATWSSATPTVATITSGGVATGVATGKSSISATMTGITGSTTLTVSAAALASIAVSPQGADVALGSTLPFTATGVYTDGSTQDLTSSVQWSSSTTAVATISNTGLTTSLAVGSTSITAASGSTSASATLMVTQVSGTGTNAVLGMSYDATISSSVRTFGLWYDSSHAINDPTMPIAVFIHGGGWAGGSAYSELGKPGPITPGVCTDTATAACDLASKGYAVYSINYTLATTDPATKWPVQWQDCECFMKFLAEEAGVSVPGNPQAIYLFGQSAGSHLSGMTALAPHNAFPTNCSHTSTSYTIRAVVMESAPIDLVKLAAVATAKTNITGLLGCDPSATSATAACIDLANKADPITYVAAGQPATMVGSGMGDTQIPYTFQGTLQAAYAALTPPVVSQWTVYPLTFNHDLDLFYYADCTQNKEPSPCGSAGTAFQDILAFFVAHGGNQ